jgi:hypothetical protein
MTNIVYALKGSFVLISILGIMAAALMDSMPLAIISFVICPVGIFIVNKLEGVL